MKLYRHFTLAFAAASLLAPLNAAANDNDNVKESIPERVMILTGDRDSLNHTLMAVLYDTEDLNFQDPRAPRFLLVDRSGNTALGIGGYVEGVGMYDMRGAIDDNGFAVEEIPIPANPELRNRLKFDASNTTIFLRLVRHTGIGTLSAYVQGAFSGYKGAGFKLKYAYVSLDDITVGLNRSVFVDGAAGAPTIDYQGQAGGTTGRNVGLSYTPHFGKGWRAGVAVEMPNATYTTVDAENKSINQRVPDIPAYIQYSWADGSHVRASAIFRDLSYRDLVTAQNRFKTGWGVQLSGMANCTDYLTFYYQALYGQGIGNYVNDLSGFGYDLIPDAEKGQLKAPHSLSLVGGLQVNITKNFFVSGSYSLNRLYDQQTLGTDAYKRGTYVCANAFYTFLSDFQVGVEYLHGIRRNIDGASNTANRIEAMVKYSF